jgi:hypothetical protein
MYGVLVDSVPTNLIGNCCLGVLCRISLDDGVPVRTNENGLIHGLMITEGYQPGMYCHPDLKWLQWNDPTPLFGDDDDTYADRLMRMNDDLNKSFSEIADYIESLLPIIEADPVEPPKEEK